MTSDIEAGKTDNIKRAIKDMESRNKNRIPFTFTEDQMVYKKSFATDKVEDRFKGPFEITKVFTDGNRVEIKEGSKRTEQNVKNIRPMIM